MPPVVVPLNSCTDTPILPGDDQFGWPLPVCMEDPSIAARPWSSSNINTTRTTPLSELDGAIEHRLEVASHTPSTRSIDYIVKRSMRMEDSAIRYQDDSDQGNHNNNNLNSTNMANHIMNTNQGNQSVVTVGNHYAAGRVMQLPFLNCPDEITSPASLISSSRSSRRSDYIMDRRHYPAEVTTRIGSQQFPGYSLLKPADMTVINGNNNMILGTSAIQTTNALHDYSGFSLHTNGITPTSTQTNTTTTSRKVKKITGLTIVINKSPKEKWSPKMLLPINHEHMHADTYKSNDTEVKSTFNRCGPALSSSDNTISEWSPRGHNNNNNNNNNNNDAQQREVKKLPRKPRPPKCNIKRKSSPPSLSLPMLPDFSNPKRKARSHTAPLIALRPETHPPHKQPQGKKHDNQQQRRARSANGAVATKITLWLDAEGNILSASSSLPSTRLTDHRQPAVDKRPPWRYSYKGGVQSYMGYKRANTRQNRQQKQQQQQQQYKQSTHLPVLAKKPIRRACSCCKHCGRYDTPTEEYNLPARSGARNASPSLKPKQQKQILVSSQSPRGSAARLPPRTQALAVQNKKFAMYARPSQPDHNKRKLRDAIAELLRPKPMPRPVSDNSSNTSPLVVMSPEALALREEYHAICKCYGGNRWSQDVSDKQREKESTSSSRRSNAHHGTHYSVEDDEYADVLVQHGFWGEAGWMNKGKRSERFKD